MRGREGDGREGDDGGDAGQHLEAGDEADDEDGPPGAAGLEELAEGALRGHLRQDLLLHLLQVLVCAVFRLEGGARVAVEVPGTRVD